MHAWMEPCMPSVTKPPQTGLALPHGSDASWCTGAVLIFIDTATAQLQQVQQACIGRILLEEPAPSAGRTHPPAQAPPSRLEPLQEDEEAIEASVEAVAARMRAAKANRHQTQLLDPAEAPRR